MNGERATLSPHILTELGLPTDIQCSEDGSCLSDQCPYYEVVTNSVSLCVVPGQGTTAVLGPCTVVLQAALKLLKTRTLKPEPNDSILVMDVDSGRSLWLDTKTATDPERRRNAFMLAARSLDVPLWQTQPFLQWSREEDGGFLVNDVLWSRYGQGSTLKEAAAACLAQIDDYADEIVGSALLSSRLAGEAACLDRAWVGNEVVDGDPDTRTPVLPLHEAQDEDPDLEPYKKVINELIPWLTAAYVNPHVLPKPYEARFEDDVVEFRSGTVSYVMKTEEFGRRLLGLDYVFDLTAENTTRPGYNEWSNIWTQVLDKCEKISGRFLSGDPEPGDQE